MATYGIRSDTKEMIRHRPKSASALSHAIAVMAISHSYGFTKIPFLQEAMELSLEVIVDSQLECGGFAPGFDSAGQWDTRLSVWCTWAMLAARTGGSVNQGQREAFDRSRAFFRKTCRMKDGRFSRSQTLPLATDDSLTIAGLFMKSQLGGNNRSEARQDTKTVHDIQFPRFEMLSKAPNEWKKVDLNTMESWVFASDLLFHRKHWRKWIDALVDTLRRNQRNDGYWEPSKKDGFERGDEGGRLAATCFCILAITYSRRYLPTFDKKTIDSFNESTESLGDGGGMVIEVGD